MTASTAVFEYNMLSYRRTWRGSVLSSFVLPVLFVIGFGLSVGTLVNTAGLGGGSYLSYIAPGMIATTAMQVGIGEATFPVMAKFRWIRTYHAMVATPVTATDVLVGDALYVTLRILITSTVFLGVVGLFGAVHSWWAITVPLVAGLVGLAFAAPMYALAATIENAGYFALIQRLLVIPMSLFAGVFYPVTGLPPGVRAVAYASPLWHGVELARAAMDGTGSLPAIARHAGYLMLWLVVGAWLTVRAFRARLSD
jgi:lipooligosaccharide transport system permease protein